MNRFLLTDVVISDRSGKVLFESKSAKTSVSLWNLLRGVLAVDVKAKAYGGELLLKALQGPSRQYINVDASSLEVGSYSLLKDAGFRLSGKMGGNIEMTGGTGKGRIWLKGLTSRELKINGFPVPDLDFDQCWLEADIKGDRMTIRKLELNGRELKVIGVGDVVLREKGTLRLTFRLKPSERLAQEQAGFMSMLKNKDAEGYYLLSVGGTLDAPIPRM